MILRHGWGATFDPRTSNGYLNEYVGSFKRGVRHGEGQTYFDNGVYDGNWKSNKRSGQGIMWYSDGAIYLGEWFDDKFHGHGVLIQGKEDVQQN